MRDNLWLVPLFWVLVLMYLLFSLLAEVQAPLTDWNKAYTNAKKGKVARLVVVDATTPRSEAFSAVLIDGHKEYTLGTVSFYAKNPASFVFDMTPILKELPQAPSDEARIVLRGLNGVSVKYTKMVIELK